MNRLLSLVTCLFISLTISGHPWKPSHYVIVDTDGGIDDLKSLTLLLASPDVRILAVTVSPGILSADNAYIKVKSLLNGFFHEGVPVGINREDKYKSENFQTALQFRWGTESGIDPGEAGDALVTIGEILRTGNDKISFICLGSMSTAYSAFSKTTLFRSRVKEIIWSLDGSGNNNGFNYTIDKNASEKMLRQEIPVKIVRSYKLAGSDFYDAGVLSSIHKTDNIYGRKITDFFAAEAVRNHPFTFNAADEMAAVFIHYPALFISMTTGMITECIPSDSTGIKEGLIKILKGETVAKNQVVREIPADPAFYFEDIRPFVNDIISSYGMEEWASGVIANELHRHLGVFAIIGVKMGIRAREYFHTGVDEFNTVSFAGSTPPLSCMNDGLQVSTGSTPGHGLLTVRNDTTLHASAEFTYMNHRIRLTLKPEIEKKILSELKEINFIYGLDSNIYWELVRKNSIKYWKELDRHEIFVIEEKK